DDPPHARDRGGRTGAGPGPRTRPPPATDRVPEVPPPPPAGHPARPDGRGAGRTRRGVRLRPPGPRRRRDARDGLRDRARGHARVPPAPRPPVVRHLPDRRAGADDPRLRRGPVVPILLGRHPPPAPPPRRLRRRPPLPARRRGPPARPA